MGPADKRPVMPELAWMLLPESHRYILKFEVECNYLQALEGDIDDSHFAFLHSRLDPDTSKPFLERVRNGVISVAGQGIKRFYVEDTRPQAMLTETDVGITMAWRRDTGEGVYSWHVNHWFMPYGMVMGGAPGTSQLGALRVPIDDEHSWQFRIRWNPYKPLSDGELQDYKTAGVLFPELIPGTFRCKENKDNDYLIDRDAQRRSSASGIKSQVQQDRAVNEPIGAIYDRTKEHLGTSDAAVIAVRRRLLRAARELSQGVEPYGASHGDVWRLIPVDLELPKNVPIRGRCAGVDERRADGAGASGTASRKGAVPSAASPDPTTFIHVLRVAWISLAEPLLTCAPRIKLIGSTRGRCVRGRNRALTECDSVVGKGGRR